MSTPILYPHTPIDPTTLTRGMNVHYVQVFAGPIYNGTIAGDPYLTQDEPGDEPYYVVPVLATGAGSPTSWPVHRIGFGHVPLKQWP